MNTIKALRQSINCLAVTNINRALFKYIHFASRFYMSTADTLELNELGLGNTKYQKFTLNDLPIRYFMKTGDSFVFPDLDKLNSDELNKLTLDLITRNKDKELLMLILHCKENNKVISECVVKQLFTKYSLAGKVNIVKEIQAYYEFVCSEIVNRNGGYHHYVAQAQCMKGNSEKGLAILKDCYTKNNCLRSVYRHMLKELIVDTVLNKSEASLVIFKRHVLEFSHSLEEHYPLLCLWHSCWVSSWFSDQMLSNELLDSSDILRNIVKDKATSFCIAALKNNYNEDAVVRLLQCLIKYEMKDDYAKVLQVLFNYKLRNRDARGCSEILRNCKVLGIQLPASQQGRYVRLLIDKADRPAAEMFKLKF